MKPVVQLEPAGCGMVSNTWERGNPYEHHVCRRSRRVAPLFLSWLGIPEGRQWLERLRVRLPAPANRIIAPTARALTARAIVAG